KNAGDISIASIAVATPVFASLPFATSAAKRSISADVNGRRKIRVPRSPTSVRPQLARLLAQSHGASAVGSIAAAIDSAAARYASTCADVTRALSASVSNGKPARRVSTGKPAVRSALVAAPGQVSVVTEFWPPKPSGAVAGERGSVTHSDSFTTSLYA